MRDATVDSSAGDAPDREVREGDAGSAPRTGSGQGEAGAGEENGTQDEWLRSTLVPVPGTSNLRDLGGIPAADGQLVAARLLYRGELLAWPGASTIHSIWNEAHSAHYRALGVRTILDLRSRREQLSTASAWPAATGGECIELPIEEGGEGTDTDYVRQIREGIRTEFTARDMAVYYGNTFRRHAGRFGAALRVVAQAERLPVLVHCSAGKDRTGMLVALLLESLGVSRDIVVAEYALTSVFRPNRVAAYAPMFEESGVDLAAVSILFDTPPAAMEAALAELDEEHGSVTRYVREVCGVSQCALDALRQNLLVP